MSSNARARELLAKVVGTEVVAKIDTDGPVPPVNPAVVEAVKQAQTQPVAQTTQVPQAEAADDFLPEVPAPEVKTQAPQTNIPQPPPQVNTEIDDAELESAVTPDKLTAKNFHNLRTKLKAFKKENKEYRAQQEEYAKLKQRLEEYDTGAAMPKVVEELTSRVNNLEQYEGIYNLKSSKSYRERFVIPVENEKAKLSSLAKEYNVSDEVVSRLLGETNNAEVNRILSEAFPDPVGAGEAKTVLKNIQKISSDALEAEKEPVKMLQQLNIDYQQAEENRRKGQREKIVSTSKEGWVESLKDIWSTQSFPEMTYSEGNVEHNEKVVQPLITQAGQEYGKFMKAFTEHGLEDLPKDVAKSFAKTVQLAHQAAVIAEDRNRLVAEVNKLNGLLDRYTKTHRPTVNNVSSGFQSNGAVKGTPKGDLKATARSLLDRVGFSG